jgi:hypothetical protein
MHSLIEIQGRLQHIFPLMPPSPLRLSGPQPLPQAQQFRHEAVALFPDQRRNPEPEDGAEAVAQAPVVPGQVEARRGDAGQRE